MAKGVNLDNENQINLTRGNYFIGITYVLCRKKILSTLDGVTIGREHKREESIMSIMFLRT